LRIDVISVAQMILSMTLCKKWVVGKLLPDDNDTEMERLNQSQMSNITNPFEDLKKKSNISYWLSPPLFCIFIYLLSHKSHSTICVFDYNHTRNINFT
jgi:hypothetical protein